MNISVDISMYPLKEGFEASIIDFIKTLRESGLKVEENGLSTQVFGPFQTVMPVVNSSIEKAMSDQENCVFAIKIVSGNRGSHVPTY